VAVGFNDGTGVAFPGKYVGSKVGSRVGNVEGEFVGWGEDFPGK